VSVSGFECCDEGAVTERAGKVSRTGGGHSQKIRQMRINLHTRCDDTALGRSTRLAEDTQSMKGIEALPITVCQCDGARKRRKIQVGLQVQNGRDQGVKSRRLTVIEV
jgi:hypothetical protein